MSHKNANDNIRRVLRSKDAAKHNYDRLSRWYDLISGSSEWHFTLAGLTLLNAQPGESILEIGYGTGKALLELSKAVAPSGYIAGIDISTGMRDVAIKRLHSADALEKVDLHCGDALCLPFQPSIFDAIFISFTLELIDTPEIPLVLAECKRVLRKEGRIAIIAMAKEENISLISHIYNWVNKAFPVFVDCRPIYVRESVIRAGFCVQTYLSKKMWGLPVNILLASK